ncbi:bifunctional aminoglycoside phosphotransferase/ATP-binding protein [Mycobacterium sp. IDR2000157661]|uniref:bifunctional aminoglycoside phosphotransferase/ATP-binding protein n=1 Tax=Mycobacterium sp. IDR2000157661 TaxID=2867005 RepID=UPI001EE9CF67|nr:AAA family ATPase [Mycobacterium sp. IDR2000157661]ULE33423.1 AAA family ATPase [Mycobacterium sp. IDR2000157661]
MSSAAPVSDRVDGSTTAGNLDAQVRETHTGLVALVGNRAYKVKKPVATDFLDFTTLESRERACAREVALNSRLSPESYFGVSHFTDPGTGAAEPVIVMRRYPDSARLASLVRGGRSVHDHLDAIAERLADFHRDSARSAAVNAGGEVGAITKRWHDNLDALSCIAGTVITADQIHEMRRLADRFIAGRESLFARRIAQRRVVDGHADLLADDIFCLSDHLAILDCLEFDDELRYLDAVDDAAFLAMDLEFLGRRDLGDHFIDAYRRHAADPAPKSLREFYIAYRAAVRAKVDCVRVMQGHPEAAADARRHFDIAREHLRSGTVQLVVIGGGPGAGKTTLARALAEPLEAEVISTDDVRRQMLRAGEISGTAGAFNAGLYAPENVAAVYDEVLRRADAALRGGRSVILDGTWRDPGRRDRARVLAQGDSCPVVELVCSAPLEEAATRVETRFATTSDATPEIAAAMSDEFIASHGGHVIDTTRPLAQSVAEAHQICCLAI